MKSFSQQQYQQAVNAGYSPQEIDSYLQQNGYVQPQAQSQQSGSLMGFLKSAGAQFLPDVAGAASMIPNELKYGVQKLQGDPNAFKNYQQAYNSNPLTNKNFSQEAQSGNYGGLAKGVGQDAAGEASYLVPFGKAAMSSKGIVPGAVNMMSKSVLPGAVAGGLQSASQDNANAGSIAGGAATGGITGGVLGGILGAGKLATGSVAKLGNTMDKTGDMFVRSQYNLPTGKSIEFGLPEATDFLRNNYGIFNKDSAQNVANQVTGKNGIFSQLLNKAIDQVPGVDIGSMGQVAKDALTPATMLKPEQKQAFLDHVQSVLGYGADGTNIVDANPSKIMNGIRTLGQVGHDLTQKNDVGAQQMGHAYRSVANELEDRLFNGYTNPNTGQAFQGVNGAILHSLKTPDVVNQVYGINPRLGAQFENNVNSARDLRHIQAPFVSISKAGNYADSAAKHTVVSPMDMIAGGLAGHINPALGLVGLLGRNVLNSNLVKTGAGYGFSQAGKGLSAVGSKSNSVVTSPALQQLLQQLGVHSVNGVNQ